MKKELKCNIKGRVQLVMFRDFTKRYAGALSLSGYVKNLKDGSVEVVAQGEEDKLNKLLELLNKGPLLARVDSIETLWMEPKEDFDSFDIVY